MVASELVNKISFVGSLTPLDKLNKGLTDSIAFGATAYASYKTAALGAQLFVSMTLESITQTKRLSKDLSVSIESLQEWEYVAKMSGGSAEGLQESMRGLAERVGEFAKFDSGEGKEVFTALGISVKDSEGKIKSADLVMQDLRKSMQKLGSSEQISIANKLGLDKSMLGTLRLTDEQFMHLQDRAKAFGIVTEEQAKIIDNYQLSMKDLGHGLDSIRMQMAISLTPVLTKSTEAFTEMLVQNREMIQNGFRQGTEIIGSFTGALKTTSNIMMQVLENTIGLDKGLWLLGAAILYVNRAMYLNPMGIFIAGVILAIGVIDDLAVAFDGGESVIKDFFASFDIDIVKELTGAFNILKGTWNGMIGVLLTLYEGWVSLLSLMEKGGKFVGFDININYDSQIEKIKALKKEYNDLSKQQITSGINTMIDGSSITPSINQNSMLPNSMTNNNSAINNNNQSNTFNFEIKSDNPVTVGQTIRDNLNKELANANKQFNVGGQ